MKPNEKKITRLASELAQLVYETLGESTNVQKVLKEIEREGYHIEMILSAAIGSSREKLSPYLIREILSSRDSKFSETEEIIQTDYSEKDKNFLKSLKIQVTEKTSE
jgi:hypothetical protein